MLSSKTLVLYSFDAFFMLYLGVNLFKYPVDKKRLASITVLYTLSIYIIRSIYNIFNIPLGSHTIILFILFVMYCCLIYKIPLIQSIAIAYIGYTLIFLGDWIFLAPLMTKLNLIVDETFFNNWSNIFVGLSSYTFTILGSLVIFILKYRSNPNQPSNRMKVRTNETVQHLPQK